MGVKEKNYCFTTNQKREKCVLGFDLFTLTYQVQILRLYNISLGILI